ncbi:MAG: segregation/condensation protein A [Armatimonadetes bacterium]|nr:segregation/condensation protein A [Armatimonadota bacterium]
MRNELAKFSVSPPCVTALGVVAPPPIQVESDTFSGPLALLFEFVRDRRVNLLDIPLAPVCESYFLYLLSSDRSNLDESAAALVALAYLIERKAWAMLPAPEEEPIEVEEGAALGEGCIGDYQFAIAALTEFEAERLKLFFRPEGAFPSIPPEIINHEIDHLAAAFAAILGRAEPSPFETVHRARRSLASMMKSVLDAISHEYRSLEQIIPAPFTREDAVYWFLAILELIRLGSARLRLDDGNVHFARAAA